MIFSPSKLIYEIAALHTAEWNKEEYSLPLLPLFTLIQHSEASAPYNSHSVKIPEEKSQTPSSRHTNPLKMALEWLEIEGISFQQK